MVSTAADGFLFDPLKTTVGAALGPPLRKHASRRGGHGGPPLQLPFVAKSFNSRQRAVAFAG